MGLTWRMLAAFVFVGALGPGSAEARDCNGDTAVFDPTTGLSYCPEVIVIIECAPGEVMVGGNCEFSVPVPSSNPHDPSDNNGPHSTGGGPGTGATGGKNSVDQAAKAAKIAEAKAKYLRCKACKTASQSCTNQAKSAEVDCLQNNAGQALARCSERLPSDQLTVWGCTISAMGRKDCPQAESGVFDKDWGEIFGGMTDASNPNQIPVPTWQGPGVDNCALSFRDRHPGSSLSNQISGSTQGTVIFSMGPKDVASAGGSATMTNGKQFTETTVWTPATGYFEACVQLDSALTTDCTAAQSRCEMVNNCANN